MNSEFMVTLQAMRFHTLIGVLPHEADVAQPIEVDLDVWTTRPDGSRGSEGIVDYRELYSLVEATVAAGHFHYLEDFADVVAGKALAVHGVSRVVVCVRKPHAALGGPLQHAQVRVDRRRE